MTTAVRRTKAAIAALRTEATQVQVATAVAVPTPEAQRVVTPAATAVRRAAVRVAPRVTIDW